MGVHVRRGHQPLSRRVLAVQGEAEDRVPSAAVAPDSVEQVQAVVRIANRYRIPLWTISTGRIWATAARRRLLRQRHRRLEAHESHPRGQRQDALRRRRARRQLLRSVSLHPGAKAQGLDRSRRSRLGQPRRQCARARRRAHADARPLERRCGLEVVLANGEVLRTGMGAMPNSEVWHQYKYGFGPIVDGLFSQSNFGIVTRMGFWLMPAPEAYSRARDGRAARRLVPFMETLRVSHELRHLARHDAAREPVAELSRHRKAARSSKCRAGRRPSSSTAWRASGTCRTGARELRFWGPPKLIDAQWEYVKEKFGAIPGAPFATAAATCFRPTGSIRTIRRSIVALGIPTLRACSACCKAGAHLVLADHPDDGRSGLQGAARLRAALRRARRAGRISSRRCRGRSPARVVSSIACRWRATSSRTGRSREIFERLVEVAAENGWAEYRTHIAFMDKVAETYSFNDHAMRRFHETLKDAVDPNGILSPASPASGPRACERREHENQARGPRRVGLGTSLWRRDRAGAGGRTRPSGVRQMVHALPRCRRREAGHDCGGGALQRRQAGCARRAHRLDGCWNQDGSAKRGVRDAKVPEDGSHRGPISTRSCPT